IARTNLVRSLPTLRWRRLYQEHANCGQRDPHRGAQDCCQRRRQGCDSSGASRCRQGAEIALQQIPRRTRGSAAPAGAGAQRSAIASREVRPGLVRRFGSRNQFLCPGRTQGHRSPASVKRGIISAEDDKMADYAHPETLVSTDWVAQHATDPNVRIAEVDVDTKAYDEGHVPGALGWNWNTQLCDTTRR